MPDDRGSPISFTKETILSDFNIERFYNPKRRHPTIGYLSPMTFEERAMKA